MSANEEAGRGGTVWDAPNKQVLGLDPPWVEGTGGDEGGGEQPANGDGLEQLTKAQLLEQAQQLGVSPANNDMTKAELIDGIRAA